MFVIDNGIPNLRGALYQDSEFVSLVARLEKYSIHMYRVFIKLSENTSLILLNTLAIGRTKVYFTYYCSEIKNSRLDNKTVGF